MPLFHIRHHHLFPACHARREPSEQNCYSEFPASLSYMDSPCFASEIYNDEERVCGHISGFVREPFSFRALMVVARQLLGILTA